MVSGPLPPDLEDFAQSSGASGLIVSQLPARSAEEIATAFAQLPQKVVWRYTGSRPSTLGNNTLLVEWMPQHDLLGHSKTRLFVSHGGNNGIQEAIYYGVPILGLPLMMNEQLHFRSENLQIVYCLMMVLTNMSQKLCVMD